MKIYVLEEDGSKDARGAIGVFSSREKAESAFPLKRHFAMVYTVIEFELDKEEKKLYTKIEKILRRG